MGVTMEFENDLGKPWRYEEDGYTVTRSSIWSPPGCHPVGCGVKLYVNEDGILEKVEGDENNPVTNGRLCVRCLALKDYLYNPSRVIHPMKRAREDRGKDKWVQTTWDDAFDIIERNTAEIKEKYGAETICLLSGTGRDGGILSQTLAHAVFGTPNSAYTQSGYACYEPRCASAMFASGVGYPEIDYAGGLAGGYDDPEYVVPEVIVVWGKQPLASNGDGLFGHAVLDLMRRGAKLIAIDPRVNWLTTRAILQLRLRPGTDAALGLALIDVIVKEELDDKDFVEKGTWGFDELAARAAEMPPERAAEICGLDVDDIYAVARTYAQAKPASIAWGLAIDQQQNGVQAGHCILSLMALTGNLDVPGGQLMGGEFQDDTVVPNYGWNKLDPELRAKTIGMDQYPYYVNSILNAHADLLLDALETGDPYQFHMVIVQSNNLLSPTNSAQPQRWHKALQKLDFGVGTDLFITPTIQACCDVFLPLATAAEKDSINMTHYTLSPVTYGATNKALTIGECKDDYQIIWELGKRLNPDIWNEDTYTDLHDFIADVRLAREMTFAELRDKVYHKRGVTYRKYEKGLLRPNGELGFNTRSGRFEFYSYLFQYYGDDPLPYYQEPPFSPVSTPEIAEKYPFILMTGAREYASFHSEHRQVVPLRELVPNPLLEIHPDDAAKCAVADGQWVRIENQFGQAKFKAKVTPTVFPGTVHAHHGWWFPEDDPEEPSLFGVWKSNCNCLVPHKQIGKLGYGAPFKNSLCSVTPLAENLDLDLKDFAERFGKLVY